MDNTLMAMFEQWLKDNFAAQLETLRAERENDLNRIRELECEREGFLNRLSQMSRDIETLAGRIRQREMCAPNEFSVDEKIANAIDEFLDSYQLRDRIADAIHNFVENSDNIVSTNDVNDIVRDFINDNVRIEVD